MPEPENRWIGFVLLHPKELPNLEEIKRKVIEEHGPVTFEMKDSPSSGEIFTIFKELHVFKANEEDHPMPNDIQSIPDKACDKCGSLGRHSLFNGVPLCKQHGDEHLNEIQQRLYCNHGISREKFCKECDYDKLKLRL